MEKKSKTATDMLQEATGKIKERNKKQEEQLALMKRKEKRLKKARPWALAAGIIVGLCHALTEYFIFTVKIPGISFALGLGVYAVIYLIMDRHIEKTTT